MMVRKPSGEMSLQQWNIATKTTTVLLPFANRIIGFPVVKGDTVLYSCSNNGKDEIWAYVGSAREHYQLASYQTGLYGATIGGNGQLVASAFTSSGYRLGTFAPQWQRIDMDRDTLVGLYVDKPFGAMANGTLQVAPQKSQYVSHRYAKLSHPFNFHSLQPDYSNPIFSLTLYGENVLGTVQNQVYYNYNRNEGYSQVGYNITYGITYLQPFIDVSEVFGQKHCGQAAKQVYLQRMDRHCGLAIATQLVGWQRVSVPHDAGSLWLRQPTIYRCSPKSLQIISQMAIWKRRCRL